MKQRMKKGINECALPRQTSRINQKATEWQEEMSPFFVAVAEQAKSRGFEVGSVKGGTLILNLNGRFAAMVDESGAMGYHPYNEVFDLMDDVAKLRRSIAVEEPEQGMQMNM